MAQHTAEHFGDKMRLIQLTPISEKVSPVIKQNVIIFNYSTNSLTVRLLKIRCKRMYILQCTCNATLYNV